MRYDFDAHVERVNTDSLKFDFAAQRGVPADALPLWVADMDFPSPPAVLDALRARVDHGVFGYSDAAGTDYFDALSGWYARRFGWKLYSEWLVKTPGVVFGVCACIRALTREGDGVLIQPPVYYPFRESILANRRVVVENPLIEHNGKYEIDFADMEQKLAAGNVRLFILCSPHNPVGRVWTRGELTRMGDLCARYRVMVVADEIHADFVYPGHRQTVFASIKPEFAENCVTCTAPTKTFNTAGLQISNLVVQNSNMRHALKEEIRACGYGAPSLMGLVACRAAYAQGEEWFDELLVYLKGNLDALRAFLCEQTPRIRLIEPEGTYLVWLDCRDLKLSGAALDNWFLRRARLWLDGGAMFGTGGEGFQRVNIACPRATLLEAFARLKKAYDEDFPD